MAHPLLPFSPWAQTGNSSDTNPRGHCHVAWTLRGGAYACVYICACTQVDLCAQALPASQCVSYLGLWLKGLKSVRKHTNYPHTGLKGLWEQLFGCKGGVREGRSNRARHETASKIVTHLTTMMWHKLCWFGWKVMAEKMRLRDSQKSTKRRLRAEKQKTQWRVESGQFISTSPLY